MRAALDVDGVVLHRQLVSANLDVIALEGPVVPSAACGAKGQSVHIRARHLGGGGLAATLESAARDGAGDSVGDVASSATGGCYVLWSREASLGNGNLEGLLLGRGEAVSAVNWQSMVIEIEGPYPKEAATATRKVEARILIFSVD
jgi:hypothetical protein